MMMTIWVVVWVAVVLNYSVHLGVSDGSNREEHAGSEVNVAELSYRKVVLSCFALYRIA